MTLANQSATVHSVEATPAPGPHARAAVGSTPDFAVGIIGAGAIATHHVRALGRMDNVRIVGICDVDERRAQSLADTIGGAAACSSLEQLFALSPHVVHVLTPPAFHAQHAIAALQAGCHVYIEKPLATSVADCNQIERAALEAGRQVCVGHSLLRDPFVTRALELANSGAIGRVLAVDHHRSQEYPSYQGGPLPYQFRDGGFPFRDVGVHSLYLLEAFLGEISSVQVNLGPPENDGCPLFKEWRVFVQCARGTGQLYLSWNARPLEDVLLIHGTKGTIRADVFGMSVTSRRVSRLPQHAQRILNSVKEGIGIATQAMVNVARVATRRLLRYHGLNMLVADFYHALATGEPSPVPVEKARNVVRWTEDVARVADGAKARHLSHTNRQASAKILVTGATGFIGRHLVERLLETSTDPVRVFTRYAPPAEWCDDPRIDVVMGDLGNPSSVEEAIQGISEIYHLGAAVTGTEEEFLRGTVAGTENIVASAVRHGVAKFVHMSSLSVLDLGSAQNGAIVSERWPLEPRPRERGHYSWAKLVAEQCVRNAIESHGLNAVIVRPGEVIAPGRPFLSGAAAIETRRCFVMFGNGSGSIPVTHMSELIDGLTQIERFALADRVLHVVSDNVLQQDVVRQYQKDANLKKPVVRLPLWLVLCAAGAGDWLARRLGRTSPISPYRLRAAIGRRHFHCLTPHSALDSRALDSRVSEQPADTRSVAPGIPG